MSSTHCRSTWLLPVLVLLLVFAGTPAVGTGPDAEERPPGSTTHVDVTIGGSAVDDADIVLHAGWTTRYPARSEEEARRAQNETLDIPWFRGGQEMAAFAARYPNAEIRPTLLRVQSLSTEGEHGMIRVSTGTSIHLQFDSERERIVIGSQLVQNLSAGDRLTIEVDRDWKPEVVTTEAQPSGIDSTAYVWRIWNDSSPRFVLNESGVSQSASGGDMGSDPIVPVVALALVAALLAARAKYRG